MVLLLEQGVGEVVLLGQGVPVVLPLGQCVWMVLLLEQGVGEVVLLVLIVLQLNQESLAVVEVVAVHLIEG